MLIPTAAATLIGPELDSADGVSPPPSVSPALPPLLLRVSFPKPRSPATCESTLWSVIGAESSPGAPAAGAVAAALEADTVDAEGLSAPDVLATGGSA